MLCSRKLHCFWHNYCGSVSQVFLQHRELTIVSLSYSYITLQVCIPVGCALPACLPSIGGSAFWGWVICLLRGSAFWEGGLPAHSIVGRQTPSMDRMTYASENITMPHTSYAGGNLERLPSVINISKRMSYKIVFQKNMLFHWTMLFHVQSTVVSSNGGAERPELLLQCNQLRYWQPDLEDLDCSTFFLLFFSQYSWTNLKSRQGEISLREFIADSLTGKNGFDRTKPQLSLPEEDTSKLNLKRSSKIPSFYAGRIQFKVLTTLSLKCKGF